MRNSFTFEAIGELFGLNVTVFGKVRIVAAFCGEKPVGVNEVDAVSVSCDPDCLWHELVLVWLLDVILYQSLLI
jgi:hypothetical protein